MTLGRSERPKEASFDLTPMIDVLLLLIVFFMMTSQFARTQLRPINLPDEPGEGQDQPSTHAVFLDLDAQGRLFALGHPVDTADIASVIGAAPVSGEDGGVEVIIRADQACAAVHLNRLAEALARQGVRTWKLATAPSGQRPSGGSTPP